MTKCDLESNHSKRPLSVSPPVLSLPSHLPAMHVLTPYVLTALCATSCVLAAGPELNRHHQDPLNHYTEGVHDMTLANCFPAIGFKMPASVPSSIKNWWCDPGLEYAFLGFSYEVSECQSLSKLKREFKDVRNSFDGRYIRMYGACDRTGF